MQADLEEKVQLKNRLLDDKVKRTEHLSGLQHELQLGKHRYELLMKEREIVRLNLNSIASENEKIADKVTLMRSCIENSEKDATEKRCKLNETHSNRMEELRNEKQCLGNSLNVVKRKLINILKQTEYWEKKLIKRRARGERRKSLTGAQNKQTDVEESAKVAEVRDINNVEMSTVPGILIKSPGQKGGSPKRVQFQGIPSNSTASADLGANIPENNWVFVI